MNFNWYGNNELDKIQNIGSFSHKQGKIELAIAINRMGNDGLSHYEIQNVLKNKGINIDTTTIRTILSS